MRLEHPDHIEHFYERLTPFMLPTEAENNILFGIMSSIRSGRNDEWYGAWVEDERGTVIAAALRTPPHGLLLSTTDVPEAIDLIAADVCAYYPTIPHVNARVDLAARFAKEWTVLSGQRVDGGMHQRVYRLETVTPPEGIPGCLRHAYDSERELLYEWMPAAYVDMFGKVDEEQVRQTVDRIMAQPEAERALMMWEVDGEPVSYAAAMGPTPNGIRINNVYTPPQYRRRGYASACVAAISQRQLDLGRKFCFLFTDLDNPTSNSIYQKVGYRPVMDVDMINFAEADR